MARSTTCRGTKRTGDPCGSVVVLPSGYCFLHDPDRKAQARDASARGGKGKSRLARVERLVPSTLRPLLATLLDAVDETRRGDLDPKVASALAALAGAAVRVYQSATTAQQIEDLQKQINSLKPTDPTTTRRTA
ncbi:MAG: hypothetical protein AB7R89_33515 [Dehalococcoidia bacterium]